MPKTRTSGQGRQKGSHNKFNADLKAMILGALHDAGGREYLAQRAIDTPGPFLALLGKILPMQLTGDRNSPLLIDFRWAGEPVQAPQIEAVSQDNALDVEVIWQSDELEEQAE